MVRNKPEESRFVNEQEVAYIREEQLPTTTREAAAPVAPEFNYCWLDKLIRTKQVEELSCSKQVFRCWDIYGVALGYFSMVGIVSVLMSGYPSIDHRARIRSDEFCRAGGGAILRDGNGQLYRRRAF